MHNDYNSWEKEVERERKEGLYYILFIIILGLGLISFVLFYGKGLYHYFVTDRGCVEREDIYFNKKDSLWHLKSSEAIFDGILCDFQGDSRYIDGKEEGPHSSYYQKNDYASDLKFFFRRRFLFSHTKKWTMNYSNGQLNGIREEYDLDGNVIKYWNYSNGKLHGESGIYVNGQWEKEQYINGVLINTSKKNTQDNIEKLDDAVVLIELYDVFGDFYGHGSGFIIDKYGTVVTNYHNIDGAYTMKVVIEKNGYRKRYDVQEIISGSESKDIAKIAIKRSNSEYFSFLHLSDSYPEKGEECWAIGTPLDPQFMNTVSKGLVSNLRFNNSPKMIHTNASYTHGSSGGALLNSQSEVIGITSAMITDEQGDAARASLNLAISVEELKNLTEIKKERIYDTNSIPCKIAFYTDDITAGNFHFFVDGIYLGSFENYLTERPSCGDAGTITKVLNSGDHTYEIYNKKTGVSTFTDISIQPGACQTIKVRQRR